MNARWSLYIICLLLLSAVGNELDAQTVVKPVGQQNESTRHALIHQIGFDVRPGYVAPTNSFLEGNNDDRVDHLGVDLVYYFSEELKKLPVYKNARLPGMGYEKTSCGHEIPATTTPTAAGWNG